MKKVTALTVVLVWMFLAFGCGQKETKNLELSFEIADVESIEMYHYDDVPAHAEKKLIEERTDIEQLYNAFNGLKLEQKAVEEVTGASVTSFRFKLIDDTNYEIIYVGNGVKNGMIKSKDGNLECFTSVDIGWNWSYLNKSLEATTAEEGELPVYP